MGGLVGINASTGTIAASFAVAAISATGLGRGGLTGGNNGQITASYATGSVSGGSLVGGLAGSNDSSSAVTASYSTSAAGTGQTTTELQTPTGYTGIYANWNVDIDGDSSGDDPWDFGESRHYPALKNNAAAPAEQGPLEVTQTPISVKARPPQGLAFSTSPRAVRPHPPIKNQNPAYPVHL